MEFVKNVLVVLFALVVTTLLVWVLVEVAVCDPAGEEYTGAKRITVYKDKALLFEQEVEVSSTCRFTGIQKKYKWIQEGGV